MSYRYQDLYNSIKNIPAYQENREGANYLAFASRKAAEERRSNMNKVIQDWQTAHDEAKAANELRYEEILKGFDTMYGTQQEMMQGMGNIQLEDVRRSYGNAMSQSEQALINSGLASTTIRPAVQIQNTNAMTRELARVADQYNTMKLNAYSGYMGNKLGFMERREDTYPDFNQYIQIARELGNA